MDVSRALLIKAQYLRLILRRTKTAELRKTSLKSLGWIALSALGGPKGAARRVVALARFTSCEKVDVDGIVGRQSEHCVGEAELRAYLSSGHGFLWTISEVCILASPVEFAYVRGQVNFAKLDADTIRTACVEANAVLPNEMLAAAEMYLDSLHCDGLGLSRATKKRTMSDVNINDKKDQDASYAATTNSGMASKRLCMRLLSSEVVYEGCAPRSLTQLREEVAATIGCE